MLVLLLETLLLEITRNSGCTLMYSYVECANQRWGPTEVVYREWRQVSDGRTDREYTMFLSQIRTNTNQDITNEGVDKFLTTRPGICMSVQAWQMHKSTATTKTKPSYFARRNIRTLFVVPGHKSPTPVLCWYRRLGGSCHWHCHLCQTGMVVGREMGNAMTFCLSSWIAAFLLSLFLMLFFLFPLCLFLLSHEADDLQWDCILPLSSSADLVLSKSKFYLKQRSRLPDG